jgi:hypothetical protein
VRNAVTVLVRLKKAFFMVDGMAFYTLMPCGAKSYFETEIIFRKAGIPVLSLKSGFKQIAEIL